MRQSLKARAAVLCLVAGMLAGPAQSVQAAEPAKGLTSQLITDEVIAEIRQVLASPLVTISVKAQNERRQGLDQAGIDELDQQWRAEREQPVKPLIAATLSGPLSSYLTRVQAASLGRYSEIFVMDRFGLNVGQSAITSDYWQGDEAKYQKTFPVGPDAVFIDEAEWNEGTRTWRAQVNLTIADPATGQAIGAATFELNLTELQRRAIVQ